jgi:hypothetical protein
MEEGDGDGAVPGDGDGGALDDGDDISVCLSACVCVGVASRGRKRPEDL